MRIRSLILLSVVLGLLGILAGCGPKKETATTGQNTPDVKPGVPVSAVTIAAVDLAETIDVTGTLLPTSEVTVGCRYAGRIGQILVQEGTPVKRGQVVARMEQQDNRAQLDSVLAAESAAEIHLEQAKKAGVVTAQAKAKQARATKRSIKATTEAGVNAAQAALDAARSRLTELKNGSRSQERTVVVNAVRVAQANYTNAQSDYDRYQKLYDNDAVSHSTLDKYVTALAVAKAQLDSAQAQLSMIKEGTRQEDIDAAQAAVRQAEEGVATAKANRTEIEVADANVAIADAGVKQAMADVKAAEAAVTQAREAVVNAKNLLSYTDIVSPVDGVVSKKIAEAGQSVAANIAVMTISTNSSLYFEAGVSELQATHLRSGQPVKLAVDAMQGDASNIYGGNAGHSEQIMGMVERVVPVVNAQTRNFKVRVTVPHTKSLYPGMFARGSVTVLNHPHCIAVPKDAMLEKDGQQVVFVVENGIAHLRTIKPGVSDGGKYVQALSGVSLGDQVITVGQQSLQDKDPVKVLK